MEIAVLFIASQPSLNSVKQTTRVSGINQPVTSSQELVLFFPPRTSNTYFLGENIHRCPGQKSSGRNLSYFLINYTKMFGISHLVHAAKLKKTCYGFLSCILLHMDCTLISLPGDAFWSWSFQLAPEQPLKAFLAKTTFHPTPLVCTDCMADNISPQVIKGLPGASHIMHGGIDYCIHHGCHLADHVFRYDQRAFDHKRNRQDLPRPAIMIALVLYTGKHEEGEQRSSGSRGSIDIGFVSIISRF
ncbi:hypothetical protein J6590_035182 [Homalodisca vitripennis]|nr:hypothetical protein J6590_035182 [Homalodisca vitripennis]